MAEAPRVDRAGLVGCAIAAALGVAALAYSGGFSPLGSVFPRTVAALMIVFAAWYAVLALRRPTAPAAAGAGSNVRRAGVMAVMLGWAFAIEPLGFLFASVCACLALLLLAQHDRWTRGAALRDGGAVLLVLAALYLLFRFALKVPLPTGLFL